ncbi:orotidine-5'-phosphate decarboxylase [Treponema endosymbiont of Eucomonympha sp.]|uniref:orotidine-5'-phosphate decarboxylase n=1 Tax=Treponema endosymbiont of Eucomonympha sp. TaxID=1580831 RepID=UPI0007824DA5|nr:orotidine-5'-phosphate decarboxylase [Treponema endosymbiont of Eucomonympha sp.]
MTKLHEMTRLREMAERNGPLCVGLDTDPSYLPEAALRREPSPAAAVAAYNQKILARLGNAAACCKVQIAYYEALGLEGLRAYRDTLRAVKAAGLPVIADVKRGDIADTARAYARAHFSGDFEADCITVNPYMGFDTLAPFLEWARSESGGKGVFVLLATSNAGKADIECQRLASGGTVLDLVGAELVRLSAPDSPLGAVVGCTDETDARRLRDACRDLFFLIPGYGAQGGAAQIAATLLDRAGGVVNSSRGILCAWKTDSRLSGKAAAGTLTLDDLADSAAEAAFAAKKDLLAAKALPAQRTGNDRVS